MTTMNSEFKPCPYCGGADIDFYSAVTSNKRYGKYLTIVYAKCTFCGARSRAFNDFISMEEAEDLAIKAWNRRIDDVHNDK